ncbi:MAG: AAA family ATPase [Planctomycetes bacterium]|nr:AAA family ATPase [Planctomycetota bacterium]
MLHSVTKVESLKACGAFRDFKWTSTVGNATQFKRRNVFFGWNGSGKTTLSRVFRCIESWQTGNAEDSGLEPGWQAKLRIAGRADPVKVVEDKANDFPPVRVFNSDFIMESVVGVDGPLSPIITLGKESANDAKRLATLESDLREVHRTNAAINEKLEKAEKEWKKRCSGQAGAIKVALEGSGISEFRNFNAPRLMARLDKFKDDKKAIQEATLSGKDLQLHRSMLASEEKSRLDLLHYDEGGDAELAEQVVETCGRSVVVQAIEALGESPDIESWVGEGLALHLSHDAKTCLYCGQSLPPSRVKALEGHFDSAYTDLLYDLGKLEALLEEVLESLDELKSKLPPIAAVLKPHQPACTKALDLLTARVGVRRKVLEKALKFVQQRRAQPLKAVRARIDEIPSLKSELDALGKVIASHNRDVTNRQSLLETACSKIADHMVLKLKDDWLSYLSLQEKSDKRLKLLVHQEEHLIDELSALRKEVEGHGRTADTLNRDLADYLGHGDLTLTPVDTGYRLDRRGAETSVLSLSEGEKTALAVLYFLRTLDAKGFDRTRALIVVDDPVSSLDSNALFAAIAYMCSRLDDAGQLILLTHNFTAFREWKKWAARGTGGAEYFQCKAVEEDGRRSCTIGPLDELLQYYETEYHYLFDYVVRASKGECRAHELLPLPNVARRVLEAFLAFKRPRASEGPRVSKQGKSADLDLFQFKGMLKGFSDDRLSRLDRFVNTFSHNDRVVVPGADVNPLGEAKRHAEDLLVFMDLLDSHHVSEMKQVIAAEVEPVRAASKKTADSKESAEPAVAVKAKK